jgi:hypothetical protein
MPNVLSTRAFALICVAAGSSGCKSATTVGAGAVYAAGPVLIHDPMGIERVRFPSRKTGVDFEHQEALLESAAGGSSTSVQNGNVYRTTTTVVTRSPSVTKKGFERMSPRSWSANVHVDASRWTFWPILFFVGRAYVEAQGDVVDVEVAR